MTEKVTEYIQNKVTLSIEYFVLLESFNVVFNCFSTVFNYKCPQSKLRIASYSGPSSKHHMHLRYQGIFIADSLKASNILSPLHCCG